jgi:acetyl-CoA C-acetyltransferase
MVASIDPAFAGIPGARHEAACASGSVAAMSAIARLEAGWSVLA